MPLRLDIKRKLTARSDRVKSCDLHPTEQWMLVSLYNGNVHIWNHESQQLVKSFEVCELPVRAAIFVPRKNWVVTVLPPSRRSMLKEKAPRRGAPCQVVHREIVAAGRIRRLNVFPKRLLWIPRVLLI